MHQAHLYRDWDFGEGDLLLFKKQWAEVNLEMKLLIGLNTVENILMLIPLVYTGQFLSF